MVSVDKVRNTSVFNNNPVVEPVVPGASPEEDAVTGVEIQASAPVNPGKKPKQGNRYIASLNICLRLCLPSCPLVLMAWIEWSISRTTQLTQIGKSSHSEENIQSNHQ